jgi:hypothetical protein
MPSAVWKGKEYKNSTSDYRKINSPNFLSRSEPISSQGDRRQMMQVLMYRLDDSLEEFTSLIKYSRPALVCRFWQLVYDVFIFTLQWTLVTSASGLLLRMTPKSIVSSTKNWQHFMHGVYTTVAADIGANVGWGEMFSLHQRYGGYFDNISRNLVFSREYVIR